MTVYRPSSVVTISKGSPDSHDPVTRGNFNAGLTNGTWWLWGVFQFSVSIIPSGGTPYVWVWAQNNYLSTDALYTVDKLSSNPTMSTLTWNNCPSVTSTASDTEQFHAQVDFDTDRGWHAIDISDIVTSSGTVTLAIHAGEIESESEYSSHCTFYDETGSKSPCITLSDYYVDAVNGNDSNAGTTPGTAWKTMDKAADDTPANKTVTFIGDFTGEPTPNKIFPDNDGVIYNWISKVTAENNN